VKPSWGTSTTSPCAAVGAASAAARLRRVRRWPVWAFLAALSAAPWPDDRYWQGSAGVGQGCWTRAIGGVADDALVSVLLALRAPLMMPMMTGKTNIRPVDGPAVTDRDKHYA